jgi:4-amino-4-deoxy-L-arabinose transferase-like glycosyltransferase
MKFIRAHLLEIGIFAALVGFFFFTRIYHLTSLPIFTDEAIYIRWAQIAKNDPDWRFISLTDGKGPLFIWGISTALFIFKDPLFSGRIVSVVAGFFTMIGLYMLGKTTFKNTWIGYLSAVLYLVYPMGMVYDRMALYDSLVGTFAVWSLYLTVLFVRTMGISYAVGLGIIAGLSVLNKTNGFLNIYLLPFSLILFDLGKKELKKRFIRWILLAGVATVLTYAIYSLLRISPLYFMIKVKDGTFIYPLGEWIHHPFLQLTDNFSSLLSAFYGYSTIAFIVLYCGAFIISRKFFKEKTILLFWFLAPFIAFGILAKLTYPRYILPMTLSLLPLAGFTLYSLYQKSRNKLLAGIAIAIFLFLPVRNSYLVLTDFENSPIPKSDLNQYIIDWPSGKGVKESISYFEKQAQKGEIYIYTEGTFGLMPYALESYLIENPHVTLKGLWPVDNLPTEEVIQTSKKMPTYIVFYQPCPSCSKVTYEAPPQWPVKKVLQAWRKNGSAYTVYQIIPK